MKNFIEITDKFGGKLFLNKDWIVAVMERDQEFGTWIGLRSKYSFEVKESYEQVKRLMDQT